jgi:predicted RNA-binding Zn-ribbon protein involved in translation (DUF1610 family)
MQTKMICPECGHPMNHHAEKLIFASPGELGFDAILGGAVEESHSCPNCGTSASRLTAS